MSITTAVSEKPKTKCEMRVDRMWAKWRCKRDALSATISEKNTALLKKIELGKNEDWPDETLDADLEPDRDEIERFKRERFRHYATCGWLVIVTGLAPLMVGLPNVFNRWMSSPDMHRR